MDYYIGEEEKQRREKKKNKEVAGDLNPWDRFCLRIGRISHRGSAANSCFPAPHKAHSSPSPAVYLSIKFPPSCFSLTASLSEIDLELVLL